MGEIKKVYVDEITSLFFDGFTDESIASLLHIPVCDVTVITKELRGVYGGQFR